MRSRTPLLALVAACAAGAAGAHAVPGGVHAHGLWAAWSTQGWLWLLWGVPGALVLGGTARLWRQARVGAGVSVPRLAAFVAGWLALGVSLLSPLDALGEELFWAHMLQHEVVMLVAAPLLVLGRPLGPMVWGLPARWRPGAARLARGLGLQAATRLLTRPMAAWWAHALTLWAWHVPTLFEAALHHQLVHDAQHVSFFVGALVFWWSLFAIRSTGERLGAAVMSLFTTLLHTSVLGALLTFSEVVWYDPYVATAPLWGLSPLEDQQLGGLIMWVPGGVVYLVAALALCARLLEERPARPAKAG